jgi:DNA invertase Pin-like site-specific DNA recombinase
MSKVYGYGRLALANDDEMVEQLKVIDDYCKNHGLKLDYVFYDNGASGLSWHRKGLNNMFDVLESGDIIIVKDIARLSRSASQCIALIEQMDEMGVTLEIIK